MLYSSLKQDSVFYFITTLTLVRNIIHLPFLLLTQFRPSTESPPILILKIPIQIDTHTPPHVTKTTTMGLLDPVYNAVSNTVKGAIAGGGAVAGDTVSGLGSTISSTGRGIGDSVSGISRGWGDYAKDTGNYVKDYTKAPGKRSSTAANPLGLGSGGQSRAVPLRVENGGRPPAAKRAQTASSGALKRPNNSRRTPSSSEILANRVRAQMNAKAATPGQPAKKNGGGTTSGKAEVKKVPVVSKKK